MMGSETGTWVFPNLSSKTGYICYVNVNLETKPTLRKIYRRFQAELQHGMPTDSNGVPGAKVTQAD